MLESEEHQSKLAKELEVAKEALLFVEPRTPRPTSFQHSSQPPLSPESEPGHTSSSDPDSPRTSSPPSPSSASASDDHEESSRWSVDTHVVASFFPFPPQRLPDSPAPGSLNYPTSPLSFPRSPGLPSPPPPRFAQASTFSLPPPPQESSHFFSPSPVLRTPPLALHPQVEDQTPTQLEYLRDQVSPSNSIDPIRPTRSGHSHGSSSISMMVLDSPTHPSSTASFAVVPSYPYTSTYTTGPLQTSGSRYRRNGIHFRTNSEAGGLSAAALLPPRQLQEEDWVDETEEERPSSISPLRVKPSVKRNEAWQATTDELSLTKRKMVRAHTEKGPEGAKEKFQHRGKRAEGRKSAMEMESVSLSSRRDFREFPQTDFFPLFVSSRPNPSCSPSLRHPSGAPSTANLSLTSNLLYSSSSFLFSRFSAAFSLTLATTPRSLLRPHRNYSTSLYNPLSTVLSPPY